MRVFHSEGGPYRDPIRPHALIEQPRRLEERRWDVDGGPVRADLNCF